MPKKKNPQTAEEQAVKFRREAQALADSGELNPIAGERALDAFVRTRAKEKQKSESDQ